MGAVGTTPVPAFVKGRERTREALINAGAARTVRRFELAGRRLHACRYENGSPLTRSLVAQRDASEGHRDCDVR